MMKTKVELEFIKVFSYGTLIHKYPNSIISEDAELIGNFTLDDSGWYPCLFRYGNKTTIHGHLLNLTKEELYEADKYEDEGGLYFRREAEVKVGNSIYKSWVYFSN